MDKEGHKKRARWPYLVTGAVTLLFAGIIYSWSILKAPLAEEFGWTATQLAFNYTLTMCFFVFGGLLSGFLAKKTSPKVPMFLSAILVFAGFFLASKANADSLWLLYIAYGVLGGTGIGIVYNTMISVTNAWFPDKRGLCSGILLMCFGFSTLILGSIAGTLIELPSFGWRSTYAMLAVAIGGVVAIAGLIIKLPPAYVNLPEPKEASKAALNLPGAGDYTAKEMIRRLSFWKLAIAFTLFAAIGTNTISFAKDFAISVGADAGFAVTMVGMLSVCNGLGRICAGAVFDNFGLRKAQIVLSCAAVLAPGCALAAIAAGSFPLGTLALLLCGFAYGLCPTSTALYASAFFGRKNYAMNFSIMNMTLIPAAFTATLSGSLVTATGSYVSTFTMLIIFATVGTIINLSTKKA